MNITTHPYASALRSLMLGELLVDKGWREYIDMVLSLMDYSALRYMSYMGFPYEVSLDDSSAIIARCARVSTQGAYTILSFNEEGMPAWEYGSYAHEVPIYGIGCEVAVEEGAWKDSASLSYLAPFSVRYIAGSGALLRVATIPNLINPPYLLADRNGTLGVVDPTNPWLCPAALWEGLMSTEVYSATHGTKYEFYLEFESEGQAGGRVLHFNEYADFTLRSMGSLPYQEVITLHDIPIQALLDRFGTESKSSVIYGYDKGVMVVDSMFSVQDGRDVVSESYGSEASFYLSAEGVQLSRENSRQSGGSSWNSVRLIEPTNTKTWDVSVTSTSVASPKLNPRVENVHTDQDQQVITDENTLADGLGIVKRYNDYSATKGVLLNVVLKFPNCTQEEFTSKYPDRLELLVELLSYSTPPGCGARVDFAEGVIDSTLIIEDSVQSMSEGTLIIDGSLSRTSVVSQNGDTPSVQVSTTPSNLEWEVSIISIN